MHVNGRVAGSPVPKSEGLPRRWRSTKLKERGKGKRGARDFHQRRSVCSPSVAAGSTLNATQLIGQQNGERNADDQQRSDQRRSSGGQNIVRDEVPQATHMVLFAQRRGQNGRGEDADAVGAQVLQEPRNGSKDGRPAVAFLEQVHERTAPMSLTGRGLLREHDIGWVLWSPLQEPAGRDRGPVDGAGRVEPVGALRDEETGDGVEKSG